MPSPDAPPPDESEFLLMTVLRPLAQGEDLDEPLVEHALRSTVSTVRYALEHNPRLLQAARAQLKRAYWFLAAYTEKGYSRRREYLLGRIATLVEVVAKSAPEMSDEERESQLDVHLDEGRIKLRFLLEIASGPKRPTDMARYVPTQADSADQGMSAASKHLKQLMLAGYLHREPSGREVYYRLTRRGFEAVERHRPKLKVVPPMSPKQLPDSMGEFTPSRPQNREAA
jgi:DNA-binding MarR family transcriptional regulator